MRNQDIMDKREDQVLREYQHVTQGLSSEKEFNPATGRRDAPSSLDRLTYVTGAARENPTINNPMEAAIHAAVKRTTKRGKRELEVAGAQVAGKPFIQRRGGVGGYVVSGAEPVGARVENVIFRRPRRKGKGKGKGDDDE